MATRRLTAQFEEIADTEPDAVDFTVAGLEDDSSLWPVTRSQSEQALITVLQEGDAAVAVHDVTTAGRVLRVPMRDDPPGRRAITRRAVERALATVPHLRGTLTTAGED